MTKGSPSVAFLVTTVDPRRIDAVEALLCGIREATRKAPIHVWSTYPIVTGIGARHFWTGKVPSYTDGLNEAFASLLEETQPDLIVKLDDDVAVLGADWFQELVRGHRRHPGALLGAKLLRPDGSVQHAGGVLLRAFGRVFGAHYGDVLEVDTPLVDVERPCEFVTGAFFAVPRTLWEELGPFAPWGGWEDSEYCFRAREAGHEVWYLPRVVLQHGTGQADREKDPAAMKRYGELMNRCEERFKERYAAMLYPKPAAPSPTR